MTEEATNLSVVEKLRGARCDWSYNCDGLFAEALATIEQLQAEKARREWQPIESAPKDGTLILVTGRFGANQRPTPCDAWQRAPRIAWFEMHRTWLGFPSSKALDGEPTHWMPLPEPPNPSPPSSPSGISREDEG
jgi:hypothetical protein